MNIKYYFRKAKDVRLGDYISVLPMIMGLILTPFYKKKLKDVWAVCERKDEARDNGYHFYKYVRENHPHRKCVYVIDRNCQDYQKVSRYGATVQFGSIRHWIMYFSCKFLISSQSFKPNGYLCTLLERSGIFRPHHVFLQHGITINKPEYLEASRRRVDFFITVTPQETKFVEKELGYGENCVKMLGFPRYDALHDSEVITNRIFVMPTWRKWIVLKSEEHDNAHMDEGFSEYIKAWKSLLGSEELQRMIEKYRLEVIFYPHPNMNGILSPESVVGSNVRVACTQKEDIQDLMKSSHMLITDYSSVFFDMVYMKKPVIFYQFDEDKFRNYHYKTGWFDYHKTNFASSFDSPDDVLIKLEEVIKTRFAVSEAYLKEHGETFPLYDTKNSERLYHLLKTYD